MTINVFGWSLVTLVHCPTHTRRNGNELVNGLCRCHASNDTIKIFSLSRLNAMSFSGSLLTFFRCHTPENWHILHPFTAPSRHISIHSLQQGWPTTTHWHKSDLRDCFGVHCCRFAISNDFVFQQNCNIKSEGKRIYRII